MAIANFTIFEHLGDDFTAANFVPPPGGGVIPPAATDIGGSGHKAAQCRIFDIQCDVGAPGDTIQIVKPNGIVGKTGIEFTMTPMNTFAQTAAPQLNADTPGSITILFAAAANTVLLRVVMDSRHTVGR